MVPNAAEELYKDQINSQRVTISYQMATVNYQNFEALLPYKPPEKWQGRTVFALPKALWSLAKVPYHLLMAPLSFLMKLPDPHQGVINAKKNLYKAGRDVEESLGNLLGVVNAIKGAYLVQDAQFHKAKYDEINYGNFLEFIEVDQPAAGRKLELINKSGIWRLKDFKHLLEDLFKDTNKPVSTFIGATENQKDESWFNWARMEDVAEYFLSIKLAKMGHVLDFSKSEDIKKLQELIPQLDPKWLEAIPVSVLKQLDFAQIITIKNGEVFKAILGPEFKTDTHSEYLKGRCVEILKIIREQGKLQEVLVSMEPHHRSLIPVEDVTKLKLDNIFEKDPEVVLDILGKGNRFTDLVDTIEKGNKIHIYSCFSSVPEKRLENIPSQYVRKIPLDVLQNLGADGKIPSLLTSTFSIWGDASFSNEVWQVILPYLTHKQLVGIPPQEAKRIDFNVILNQLIEDESKIRAILWDAPDIKRNDVKERRNEWIKNLDEAQFKIIWPFVSDEFKAAVKSLRGISF